MPVLRLSLNHAGSVPLGIIRIPKPGCTVLVQLSVGTSFHSAETVLQTNHPIGDSAISAIKSARTYSILEDLIFELPIITPGAWSFQLVRHDTAANPVPFIVDPVIMINGRNLSPGALVIQTNYGRCIGLLENWVSNLKAISALGYNMIHLPPFQELGDKSHYSIKDSLQLSSDLFPPGFDVRERWPLFKRTLEQIEQDLGIVFMTDVLLNHMNPEAEFLKEHPEAGYNMNNSPHLRPAYYVDKVLNELSNTIASDTVPGIQADLRPDDVPRLRQFLLAGFHDSDLKKYFTIDVEQAVEDLRAAEGDLPKRFEILRIRAANYASPQRQNIMRTRGIVDDHQFNPGSIHIDLNFARALYNPPGPSRDAHLQEFRDCLHTLNMPYVQHYNSIVSEVVDNVLNTFQYHRYDPRGPKLGRVTIETPLNWRYFSEIQTADSLIPVANNGWIFADDPTSDFISPGHEAYLRRQVVIWGDNVKLNFGNKPEDSPALWDHMREYVRSVAEVCRALRLDNAHSTPICVGEYFLREARKVNPSIYIMAELFTNSPEREIEYINRLGINSILREGLHRLEPGKLSHLLWSSGGRPVAALDVIDSEAAIAPVAQIPGVIFDFTHDNAVCDIDPLTAITAFGMSCSPVGSTRGFDDGLPFNPSVCEVRPYPLAGSGEGLGTALQSARQLVNQLHVEMSVDGMEELMSNYYGNLLSIVRYNSATGAGVWALVRLGGESTTDVVGIPAPIDLLAFEARIENKEVLPDDGVGPIKPSKMTIFINTDLSKLRSVHLDGPNAHLVDFPVGNVCVFKVRLFPHRELAPQLFGTLEVDELTTVFFEQIRNLGLIDLAILLFRHDDEEKLRLGHGAYFFPGFGAPFYAGTMGIETAFTFAAKSDAGMGSPVFSNIRDGDWLIHAICDRLRQSPHLRHLGSFLGRCYTNVTELPRFLVPKYLDRIIRSLNIAARRAVIAQCSSFVHDGDDLIHSLAISAISFFTPVDDAPLVHSRLVDSFVGGRAAQLFSRTDCSTAAGFPHFTTGFVRSWGRDTFIALRGLYLVTGRFADARDQLVGFAACLRHGLIPNLHDGGMNPRYNARDATWWFLQALQDYAIMSGENVFAIQVPRIFPSDDQLEHQRRYEQAERPIVSMASLVQEIMTKHANGIHFIEWNAGCRIDDVMQPDGFSIDIVTDWTNGFIVGGNASNCGTWMDKMGSRAKAGNAGIPATPRDGAAIEIIGLLESTLRWLKDSNEAGAYEFTGIDIKATGKHITWSQWSALLCGNFESWFYIPVNREHDRRFFIEEKYVGIRGIYKDTVGSCSEFADYQFRPNLTIAMTVAPELFDPIHVVKCLNLVEERLMGRIGMKTLDPSDSRYRPYYHNSSDTDDFLTSGGFNYHNGPEWIWPVGFFFRASMRFRRGITGPMKQMLANIKKEQIGSWACGLPELTQKDGESCGDSCLNQAWSVSAVLDLLFDYSMLTDEDVLQWDVDEEGENEFEKEEHEEE
jgi:glycogen debranching enzyme